jgi:hypothetical protein
MAGGNSLKVAYYGDDFTGATDTLATAARAGLRSLLFLGLPTDAQLERAGPLDCLGIAGAARAMNPVEMRAELEPVGRLFARLGAPVMHYKTCSTFDSAPAGRQHRRGHPHPAAACRQRLCAHRRRPAQPAALLRVRQPVRRRRPRRAPPGPAPDHEPAPDHAHARGRPAPPPGRAGPGAGRRHRLPRLRTGRRGAGQPAGRPAGTASPTRSCWTSPTTATWPPWAG